jgi:hypothetical protein
MDNFYSTKSMFLPPTFETSLEQMAALLSKKQFVKVTSPEAMGAQMSPSDSRIIETETPDRSSDESLSTSD